MDQEKKAYLIAEILIKRQLPADVITMVTNVDPEEIEMLRNKMSTYENK